MCIFLEGPPLEKLFPGLFEVVFLLPWLLMSARTSMKTLRNVPQLTNPPTQASRKSDAATNKAYTRHAMRVSRPVQTENGHQHCIRNQKHGR